ncbi:hypothetical protein CYLTODRAFT_427517, partial [Cylindrobasidium torrendii FP15055 ss-10]
MHLADRMWEKYRIRPMYGLYWNFCLNWGRGSRFVKCLPHVDAMNIAIGLCTIYIYGVFKSNELCWLCIWDAGIIVQIPPGVALTYPSALFYHFNYDIKDLKQHIERNEWEQLCKAFETADITGMRDVEILVSSTEPTKETREQCKGLGEDAMYMRGSCVFFNQATMFQTAELGMETIKEAKAAGMNTDCDWDELQRKEMFF